MEIPSTLFKEASKLIQTAGTPCITIIFICPCQLNIIRKMRFEKKKCQKRYTFYLPKNANIVLINDFQASDTHQSKQSREFPK